MKVVILAGGFGTRISEESQNMPKPMITIGGMPIIWHIMKHYSNYGYTEFVICAGYKQQIIKEWFADYYIYTSDVTFDFEKENKVVVHKKGTEPWKVTVVDTGLNTLTAGRIKRIQEYVGDETFMLTYGDGVSDVDISKLVKFHRENNRLATLCATQPGSRFGIISMEDNVVTSFREKSKDDSDWVNIGYMVLEPQIFDYIHEDCMFEKQPLENIVADRQLVCYRHEGFWQCMDTMRDRESLERLWAEGNAPWKIWDY